MKSGAVLLLLLGLAGCASALPPARPTPADIGADNAAVNATSATVASLLDYESTGLKLTRQNCLAWFTSQVAGAQGASFLTQILSMGAGAATLAGAPGAAAGAALGASGLGAYQSSFGAGAAPVAAYTLVSRVLSTEEAAVLAMPPPTSYEDADSRVSGFAELCSLPAIQSAIMQAAMVVPMSASPALVVAPPVSQAADLKQTPKSRAKSSPGPGASEASGDRASRLQSEWDSVQSMGRAAYEQQMMAMPRVVFGAH